MTLLLLLAVLLLVGLNAFFVAAEFALVAMRPSRVHQLIEQGNARAGVVHELLKDLDRVLSGVQVGITLASLGLGFVGEQAFAGFFTGLPGWIPGPYNLIIAHGVSLVLSFSILTFLHVVLGELVPKSLSLQRAERMSLLVARPLRWFLALFSWAIDSLDGASARFVRAMGVADTHGHAMVRSAEELKILIQQARERGLLELGEEQLVQSAIELGQLQVREIMVPRPDMHALPVDASLEDVMRTFATSQRSRIPVYQGSLDHVAGYIHIKDMLWILLDRERRAEEGQPPPEFRLSQLLREILIVPESKLSSELLLDFRTHRAGIGIVVDEFGSILGLVTMEDLLEQVVGEIHDEYDVVERPLTMADGAMIFDAALSSRDLENQYGISLPEDPSYETVGGFVLTHLGFVPHGGESFEHDGLRFTVVEMDRRRIARVKIQRVKPPETPAAQSGRN